MLSCKQDLQQDGTTYAVVVGISDYKQMDYRTGDLLFADDDAKRFASFLKSKKGGQVTSSNIRFLTNTQATQFNIRKAFKLFEQAQPTDRIIFYFSGHGVQGGFVPYDVNSSEDSFILHTELKEAFRNSPAKTKICIADACMAGSMRAKNWGKTTQFNTNESDVNIAMMLASRSNQPASEQKRIRGGIFTYFFLKGLEGKADVNHDNLVTIKELYNYISPRIRANTPNAQAPVFYGKFSNSLPLAYLSTN